MGTESGTISSDLAAYARSPRNSVGSRSRLTSFRRCVCWKDFFQSGHRWGSLRIPRTKWRGLA